MFDTDPIVWLQSWQSPFVTGVMNGVSLLGYTPACLALAVLLAFGFRQRAALALLVLLAVNGAITDVAKTVAAMPRPDWVSGDVQSLALFARARPPHDAGADTYGFPSGHVSASTAFAVGSAVLFHVRRRGWALAIAWIGLMALSRMYLGRHFLGDVIGGVGVGLVSVALGLAVLAAGRLALDRVPARWPFERLLVGALAAAMCALIAGLPDAGDAGRLAGIALGLTLLVRRELFDGHSIRGSVLMVLTAAAGFAIVWGLTAIVPIEGADSRASAWRLVAAALPSAAMLMAPALLPRRLVA